MRPFKLLLLAAALAAPVGARAEQAAIAAAVAAKSRPAEAVKLDASRKPAEVLKFLGLRKGDRTLDMFTGTGYYAEIMAHAVGPKGYSTGWDSASFVNATGRQAFVELKARAPNFGHYATPATSLALPDNAFDFVMIHLSYHDAYWESAKDNFPRMDPDIFLRTLYGSVKPGGVVGVIDHVANPGGDTREVVEKLHRIDPAVVRADFEKAGFVLEAESPLFRNPADDHTKLVFDPSVRYKTDRFLYRFRKPRA